MKSFSTIAMICFFLSAHCLFASVHMDNIDLLNNALKGTNFHAANFPTPAHNMKFTTPRGEKADLRQFFGKLTILSFWTINTPDWANEARNLTSLHTRYMGRGLEVIGLNLVDSADNIKNFLQSKRLNIQVGFDGDNSLSVSRRNFTAKESTAFVTDRNSVAIYEIPQYPTTYIIDKDGRILGFFIGRVDWNSVQIQKAIDAMLDPPKLELALQEEPAFQSDAGQGITLPPQAPVMGGPTKRGPTQAPLGPQAPIPVPEEMPKEEAKSLPFQAPQETGAKKNPASQKSQVRAKPQVRRPPSAKQSDTRVPSSERRALPTHVEKPRLHNGSTATRGGSRNLGQLPPAKPYYPSGSSVAPIQQDSSGRVTATIPRAESGKPNSYSGYPSNASPDLPAAQPLPNRNLIGGSILDSFGGAPQSAPKQNLSNSDKSASEPQPSNILEQIGHDFMSLGEGIRGTFSKLLGSQ